MDNNVHTVWSTTRSYRVNAYIYGAVFTVGLCAAGVMIYFIIKFATNSDEYKWLGFTFIALAVLVVTCVVYYLIHYKGWFLYKPEPKDKTTVNPTEEQEGQNQTI